MTEKKKIKRSEFEKALLTYAAQPVADVELGYDEVELILEELGIEVESDKDPQPGEVWADGAEIYWIVGEKLNKSEFGVIELFPEKEPYQCGLSWSDYTRLLEDGTYLAPDLETYYREKFETDKAPRGKPGGREVWIKTNQIPEGSYETVRDYVWAVWNTKKHEVNADNFTKFIESEKQE